MPKVTDSTEDAKTISLEDPLFIKYGPFIAPTLEILLIRVLCAIFLHI